MPALLEIAEDVGGADQIGGRAHADRRAVAEVDDGQRALGGKSVAMKDFAHQHGAEHLIELGRAAGIAPTVVAGFDRSVGELRRGERQVAPVPRLETSYLTPRGA